MGVVYVVKDTSGTIENVLAVFNPYHVACKGDAEVRREQSSSRISVYGMDDTSGNLFS